MVSECRVSYAIASETIASDPHAINGAVSYTYDPVGNRKQMTSSLAPIPAGLFNYDANDRFTAGDTYDNNGNTISSGGIGNVYDFENHLIQKGGATMLYDGDGNRVFKTVAGVTTGYMVDDRNPTGYVQVMDEVQGPFITRSYIYGLELLEQDRIDTTHLRQSTSYNVYDGHGSVRALTDTTGAVTDTYDYDAFGNLIHSTGSTPNVYLYSGEQFDPDLHLYYNRARYLNVSTGRFWTMDTYEGDSNSPLSLHKYLYTSDEPVTSTDPSGRATATEQVQAGGISEKIDATESQIVQVLNGIARATEAAEANEEAAAAAKLLIQALGFGAASLAALALLRSYVQRKAEECGCRNDNILFHYSTLAGAAGIYTSQFMFASPAFTPDWPAGAYATDIAPWDASYTRTSLAQTIYFRPGRQQSAIDTTTTYFVALCNDMQPGFQQLPTHPREWAKTDIIPFADLVSVHAIFWAVNPMRR